MNTAKQIVEKYLHDISEFGQSKANNALEKRLIAYAQYHVNIATRKIAENVLIHSRTISNAPFNSYNREGLSGQVLAIQLKDETYRFEINKQEILEMTKNQVNE
jgi:hypothetical protein